MTQHTGAPLSRGHPASQSVQKPLSPSNSMSRSRVCATAQTHALDDIDLPPQASIELIAQIHETVDHVLDEMIGDAPSKTYWRPKGEKNGVSFFVDDNVKPGQYRFCCVSETSARTEDVMNLFMVTDATQLTKTNRILHDNVLEARVLKVLEQPSRCNPFKSVYLRYSSYEAPMLMRDRDLCVVVATDMFTHADGSTVGCCLWDSVDIPECAEYTASSDLVRSRMFRSGFFSRTTNDPQGSGPTTKIVYLIGMEPGGVMAPKIAAWMLMQRFGDVVSRLCAHFRRKHLDPSTFRPRHEWPSAWHAKACRSCDASLTNSFTARHHCAACGEVFCKACYSTEQVDLPGVGLTNARFCAQCLCIRGIDSPPTTASSSRTHSYGSDHTPPGDDTSRPRAKTSTLSYSTQC